MSIFNELKRRNVFRVALFYAIVAWLILQVSDILIPLLQLPEWAGRFTFFVLLLGFPLVFFFSWAYEITPEGLKREKDVDRSQSITTKTGRKLDFIIIGLMAIAIAYFTVDKFVLNQPADEHIAAKPQKTTSELSIAVLPFTNMTADKENEFFADGLSEELLNVLSQVQDLKVTGRTSSFFYKGKNEDLRKIGETLGVTNILEGSVRRQGDAVRITAQLVRAEDGFHLWSKTYERTLDDVFAIQDDISESVARALHIVLDDANRERMRAVGVRDVDAFIAYQKGLEISRLAHGTEEIVPTLKRAVDVLDEAIALVPEFSAAYYLKSDYYAHFLMDPGHSESEREEALVELRSVLDLAFETAQNPSRRAFIDFDRVLFSDDWQKMPSRIERALDLDGCADHIWFQLAPIFGYTERPLEIHRRQYDCNPLDLFANLDLILAAHWAGQPELALAVSEDALKVLGPHPWVSAERARAFMLLGRFDEAAKEAAKGDPDDPFYGRVPVLVPAARGDVEAARRMIVEQSMELDDPFDIIVYAAIGDREAANSTAARIDKQAGGTAVLATVTNECLCGAPFDLETTPNFATRIKETGAPWPPVTIIKYPAKDW